MYSNINKRGIFRIPYGYLEETLFDSQKSILEDYLNEKDRIDAEQDKRLEEEINRSTGEDKDFESELKAEIERSIKVDSYIHSKIVELFKNYDDKADWNNGMFFYKNK